MMQLKQGDQCRVRILSSGKVFDAVYDRPSSYKKEHWVSIDGIYFLAVAFPVANQPCPINGWVRFVGPAGVRE